MVFLFLNELSAFVKIKTSSEMLVDMNRSSENFKINVDITLHRLPCTILSLDVQDIMGTHSLNVQGKLLKHRLDKTGTTLELLFEDKSGKRKNVPVKAHGHDGKGHDDVDMPDYDEV